MFSKTTKIDPLQILTLEEAKNQLNIIDFNDDDAYIMSLILAASDICERKTNMFFSRTQVSCRFACPQVYLPYLPYVAMVSVQIDDVDVDYSIDDFSNIITITNGVNISENVTVIYEAGYDLADIPLIITQACKIMVADFYANRESMMDSKAADVPLNALMLLNNMRVDNL